MMPFDRRPNDWTSDQALAVAAVVAVRDIAGSRGIDRDALLSALMCAAWPTRRAQNQ